MQIDIQLPRGPARETQKGNSEKIPRFFSRSDAAVNRPGLARRPPLNIETGGGGATVTSIVTAPMIVGDRPRALNSAIKRL